MNAPGPLAPPVPVRGRVPRAARGEDLFGPRSEERSAKREHRTRPHIRSIWLVGFAIAGWGAGCGSGCMTDEVSLGGNAEDVYTLVADVPPVFVRDLDLLFVVDNTASMMARRAEILASFTQLANRLAFLEGGMPDLHLGVVTSDLGAGSPSVAGCSAAGEDGVLRRMHSPGCGPIEEMFLTDVSAGEDRVRNFAGSLTQAFDCMLPRQTSACPYTQPLGAARRALDGRHASNTGFLRDEAVLAVVFVAGSDDCSAATDTLFNPALPEAVGAPLFRCFQFGVQCAGDDVYAPGPRSGCRARPASPYLESVPEIALLLESLVDEPRRIVVAGLVGDPNQVVVGLDGGDAQTLEPACRDHAGPAYPGVRLRSFLDGFAERNALASVCAPPASQPIATAADRMRRALGTSCLEGHIRDVEPGVAGRQPDCRAYFELPGPVAGARVRKPIAACDAPYDTSRSTHLPCYALLTGGEACGHYPTQLAVKIEAGAGDTPADAHVIVECVVDEPPLAQ
jgi:hypothetical protein